MLFLLGFGAGWAASRIYDQIRLEMLPEPVLTHADLRDIYDSTRAGES